MFEGEIGRFNRQRAELQADIKQFLADKSMPLDYRWEIFSRCENILDVNDWMGDAIDTLSDCLYDDFNIERREVCTYLDIDEQILDNVTQEGDEPDEYSARADEMYAKRDEWREAVLAEGYFAFTNDW